MSIILDSIDIPDSILGYLQTDEKLPIMKITKNHRSGDIVYKIGNKYIDFCLPNILVRYNKVMGFIDTEASGIGDPWMDYAWCIWSFVYDLGTKQYTPLLLNALGIEFNQEKFDYYTRV